MLVIPNRSAIPIKPVTPPSATGGKACRKLARGRRAQRERERRREERCRRYFRELIDNASRAEEAPRLTAQFLSINGRERRELKGIVRSGKSEQRMVLRAKIILQAASRNPKKNQNKAIARRLDCDVHVVRKWRERFRVLRMAGLEDKPRSGRPLKFTPQQRHAVLAKVLSEPPKPLANWSLAEIAQAVVKDGIVPSISKETIGRWLREADLKPHRNKYWLNCKDPDFVAKMERVVDLYLNPPTDGIVLCLDEKTGIQALKRKAPTKLVRPGQCQRTEFEYKRGGTATLLAAFEVQTGHVTGRCLSSLLAQRNDSETFTDFIIDLMERYPYETYGKLYLIMDNGSAHTSAETASFLLSNEERLVPVFLPVHASWLNQVEMFFGVLTRRALKNVSFNSVQELIGRISDYIAYHNNYKKHPYRWTKTGQALKM